MLDKLPEGIEYRAPCYLSDHLKLQFWCTLSQFKYLWIVFAVLILVVLGSSGGSFDAVLMEPWSLALPLVFGLLGAFGLGPLIVLVRWMFGKMTKEIRATINAEGVKVIGEGFNLEGPWQHASWVKEGRSAYLLKFKQLLIRLPKRGFEYEQEDIFRRLIRENVLPSANRLSS